MLYILEHFEAKLKKIELHEAVRATYHGMEISVPNFFAIFELYCLATGSFFTPIGELGLGLHEMWEIFNLRWVQCHIRNIFSCAMELEQMEKDDREMFEMY